MSRCTRNRRLAISLRSCLSHRFAHLIDDRAEELFRNVVLGTDVLDALFFLTRRFAAGALEGSARGFARSFFALRRTKFSAASCSRRRRSAGSTIRVQLASTVTICPKSWGRWRGSGSRQFSSRSASDRGRLSHCLRRSSVTLNRA